MDSVRILYIHQYFGTPQGALGTRSYEIARRLIRRGHAVTMVTAVDARRGELLTGPFRRGLRRGVVDGIDLVEVDLTYSNHMGLMRRSWVFARYAIRSVRLSLSESYDVVYATSTPLTAALPGIAARWLRRKPFVFEVRDLWPEAPRALGVLRSPLLVAGLTLLERLAYRSANTAVGLAPGIVDGIRRHAPKRLPVILAPNACDLDLFGPQVLPWRPKDVGPQELLAVFPGAHGPANGLDALLDVAVRLQHRRDIRIVLVGDGKAKGSLMDRARREGLANVVFLEPMPKARLAGLMSGADVGLQVLANVPAFYFGTSPNKFFDFLAAGLPVVTNYPGWVAELVAKHDCGIAVPPDEPDAFARALMALADDRAAAARMGTNARSLGETQFSRDGIVGSVVNAIEGLLQGGGGSTIAHA